MRLTVIGCSGSFPGPDSPASCYLVQAHDGEREWSILLDLGNGALGPLQRHLDPRRLDGVFLTHLHPDHCLDICGLYVLLKYHPEGRLAPGPAVPVPSQHPRPVGEGAAGVADAPRLPVWGAKDSANRLTMAYTGMEEGSGMASVLDFRGLHDREVVRLGPFVITPRLVNHPVECYGLRVEADGEVLAYTGDTDVCDALGPLMQGADLVLSDSAFVEGRDARAGVHLTGRKAALAAAAAGGVRRLMLTHMPAWNDPEVCRAEAEAVWDGVVDVARPGATYPVGGQEL